MLVLSRKQQEQIKIGDQITVTIVRVKGNTVRVGIEAPRDVRVIRGEMPKLDGEPAETTVLAVSTVDASRDTLAANQGLPSGSILSFRVRCENGTVVDDAEGVKNVPVAARSAAHLPLKR